jgi:hypothetical protein
VTDILSRNASKRHRAAAISTSPNSRRSNRRGVSGEIEEQDDPDGMGSNERA